MAIPTVTVAGPAPERCFSIDRTKICRKPCLMRLTQWTDYSLRVLMYCAAIPAGREAPVTITEIAQAHGISRSHLTKIVMDLAAHGLLQTTRGRGGGLRLLRPAEDIRLGDVVRLGERDLVLVECFDPAINQCQLTGHCGLQATLGRALDAFMQVLDQTALADLIAPRNTTGAPAGTQPLRWLPPRLAGIAGPADPSAGACADPATPAAA